MKLVKNTMPEPTIYELAQAALSKNGYITIEGKAMDREIYVEGIRLDNIANLDWGYGGAGAGRLAVGLLMAIEGQYCTEDTTKLVETVNGLLNTFKMCFVVHFPSDNFTARIHYTKWCEALNDSSKRLHGFEFLELVHSVQNADEITELVFSKFLDLPYLPFKNFSFGLGSIQYNLLKQIDHDKKLHILNDYYKFHTSRKSTKSIRKDEDGKIVGDEICIKIRKYNDRYIAEHGMGRSDFYGNAIGNYKHIQL